MALERVLRHALGGSLLAVGLSVLGSACTQQQQEAAQKQRAADEVSSSFRSRVLRSTSVTTYLRVALIYSSDLHSIETWPAETLALREAGAKFAAEATRPDALGVYGVGTTTEEDFDGLIVADDLVPSSVTGQYEATIYGIIPGAVHVKGFHVTEVQIGYTTATATAPDCDRLRKGCHPVFSGGPHTYSSTSATGAGLSEATIINAQTSINAVSALGTTPELWLRPPSTISTSAINRFVCFGAVAADAGCGGVPSGPNRFPAGVQYWNVDAGFRMISEADYLKLIKLNPPTTTVTASYLTNAIVPLATFANWPNAVGITGTKVTTTINGPVIVGRDIVNINSSTAQATSFYIPTDIVKGDGVTSWTNLAVGFTGNLPDWKMNGPCGPLTFPTGTYCNLPVCLDSKYTPIFNNNPGFGMDRWPTTPRATINSNDIWSPTRTPNMYACSPIVRPWDNLTNRCGQTPAMALNAETCNGVDDNCNGRIDEEGVCAACSYEIGN